MKKRNDPEENRRIRSLQTPNSRNIHGNKKANKKAYSLRNEVMFFNINIGLLQSHLRRPKSESRVLTATKVVKETINITLSPF